MQVCHASWPCGTTAVAAAAVAHKNFSDGRLGSGKRGDTPTWQPQYPCQHLHVMHPNNAGIKRRNEAPWQPLGLYSSRRNCSTSALDFDHTLKKPKGSQCKDGRSKNARHTGVSGRESYV